MIDRFNAWYDRLQEPWRFLFFIGLMCVSVFPLHIGVNLNSPKLMLFGLITTIGVVCIAIKRAIGKRSKMVGYAMMGILTLIVLAVGVLLYTS
jgi:hypothetical protein